MRGAKDVYGGEDIIGRVDGRGGGHMEEEKYHSVGPWRSYGPLEGTLGDFLSAPPPPGQQLWESGSCPQWGG